MLGTLMLPYHVTLVPQYVLFLNLDWIDTILPLVVPKFLAHDAFFIFLMVQFFRGIPRELDEAARMDGCGPWRIYWRIMMPLSLPVLATSAIFSFIWTYDDFLGPLIYLNDITDFTVPLALRSFVDSTGESSWGQLFAMSSLSLLPVFLFFLFFQRLIIQGVATSAMKR
jgi:multiple sugar transport system permease protein